MAPAISTKPPPAFASLAATRASGRSSRRTEARDADRRARPGRLRQVVPHVQAQGPARRGRADAASRRADAREVRAGTAADGGLAARLPAPGRAAAKGRGRQDACSAPASALDGRSGGGSAAPRARARSASAAGRRAALAAAAPRRLAGGPSPAAPKRHTVSSAPQGAGASTHSGSSAASIIPRQLSGAMSFLPRWPAI